MERRSVGAIGRALNGAGVRYFIAGGFAIVAHGYVRLTADVDLVLDMKETSLRRAIAALSGLGYRMRVLVGFAEHADQATRERWVREKGLTVFSVFSGDHSAAEADLVLEAAIDFDRAFGGAKKLEVAPGLAATFVRSTNFDRYEAQGRPASEPGRSRTTRRAAQTVRGRVMNDSHPIEERGWEAGWEGRAHAQRSRLARLPLREELEWLKSAHRIVLHIAAAREGAPARRPGER